MKDLFIDFMIGIILFLCFNALLFGIIGWVVSIVIIYTDNNWIPFGILCTGAVIAIIVITVVSAINKCYRKYRRHDIR